jgi:DNA-binding NtrC family response regulator
MKKPIISETLDEMTERFLIEALRRSNGNRKDAAKLLGIHERTVYHKIIKYNITVTKSFDQTQV